MLGYYKLPEATAKAIDKFQINGDWSGDMKLTDDGTDFNRSVKKFKVKGLASDVLFQAANSVKKVQLGAARDVNFYVGIDFSVTEGLPTDVNLVTNTDAEIKKLQMKGTSGVAHEYAGSVFSAPRYKKIDLKNVDRDNGGEPFGGSAMEIKKISFDTGTGRITQKKDDAFNDNDAGDDFFIGQIT